VRDIVLIPIESALLIAVHILTLYLQRRNRINLFIWRDRSDATIEDGFGGWINSLRITGPHLRGVAVKDFLWEKDKRGWKVNFKPLGMGMVHFPQFFGMLAAAHFSGPLQLHFEYPLGGTDNGKTSITIPKEEVFAAMKRDLQQLRSYLKDAAM
jgi:sugar phosphate isomerase/epimerase